MDIKMQGDHGENGASSAELWRAFRDPVLHAALNLLPDGLIVVDQGGAIHFMNSAAQAILDCGALVGRSLTALADGVMNDVKALVEAASTGSRLNRVEVAADGRTFLVSVRPIFGSDGSLVFTMIILRNLDAIGRQANAAGQGGFVSLGDRDSGVGDAKQLCMSRRWKELVEQSVRAVRMGIRVLIMGESGVGKTQMAHYVHRMTLGPNRPFVHVNCASIPESLFESEMFGYEPGAFTGALTRGKKGYVEAADGGTLFLDEVGEVPLHCQAKLLKFLEDGMVHRVGATGGRRVSVQFFSATNRDLLGMVKEREFRKDLYYRLSSLIVEVPALRQTREIIPDLIRLFAAKLNARRDQPFQISQGCMQRLLAYDYPGNIREMQNIIEHLAVVSNDVAEEWHLPGSVRQSPLPSDERMPVPGLAPGAGMEPAALDDLGIFLPQRGQPFPQLSLKEEVRKYESYLLKEAIRSIGSKRKAAEMLGVDIATIVRKTR
ncbi:MAG TPA: sigma 54-interacting transcriptional regulator [Azospirillum sp.]|nr:sigma 54-interacting transcriptional regulator [Azospirillum sp.]